MNNDFGTGLDAINAGTYNKPPEQATNTSGGSYWIGQDGNVWFASSTGTRNMGTPINLYEGGFDATGGSAQGGQINDPNPQSGTTNLSGGGGGGRTAPTYKDTTAERNATNVSIGSLDTVLNNSLTGADSDYQGVKDAYDLEDAENLTNYKGDVEKNEITRDENTQASLLGAARGSRGLNATLASLGALGGTGRTLANRAISTEANADLGAGEKSFETNTASLFDARSAVEKQEKQRRLDANKTWKDTRQTAEYDYYKGKQDLSKEMAGHWQDAGNFGEANNWTNTASTYTPELASRTRINPAQYARTPLAYKAPELNKYLGGMNSTAVNVAGGNPVNGAIYTSTSPRRREKELV